MVELLLTLAILGTLFGIVTLALNGLASSSTVNIKKAELDQVQTAVDIYLADNYPTITTVPARAVAAVIASGDADALFNTYLRQLPTEYTYSWAAAGDVIQP